MDEPHLKHLQCGYCKAEVNEAHVEAQWGDRDEQFYQSLKQCGTCGKSDWTKMCFEGSGHGKILDEEDSLESMLSKVPRDKP